MLLVLLGLGAYYSMVTVTAREPVGADAARQVARRIGRDAGPVFVVARASEEDIAFQTVLTALLGERGVPVAAWVSGEPRDARLALERLQQAGTRLGVVAATPEAARWTVVRDLSTRFPALGDPVVILPEARRWPTFLTRRNLMNIANQITVVAILGVGMTLVILTGGIDLSVGSLLALSAVGVTVLIRDVAGGVQAGNAALWACAAAGVALSAGVGCFSGLLVAGFRVPPFITTLAVMQVASGLAFILARGNSIYEVPDAFARLGRGTGWFGVPLAVWLMAGLYGATHLLMTRTVLGRRIYAVGGNAEAARMSGVSVPSVLVFAYAFCGAMAGLAGVVQASQLQSGAPTYGQMYELYAIAAVVVGGASLSGGEGRVFGTLVGALIIAVIQNGMNLTGVEGYRQKVVLGAVILAAVLLDLLKRRDWRPFLARFRPSSADTAP